MQDCIGFPTLACSLCCKLEVSGETCPFQKRGDFLDHIGNNCWDASEKPPKRGHESSHTKTFTRWHEVASWFPGVLSRISRIKPNRRVGESPPNMVVIESGVSYLQNAYQNFRVSGKSSFMCPDSFILSPRFC